MSGDSDWSQLRMLHYLTVWWKFIQIHHSTGNPLSSWGGLSLKRRTVPLLRGPQPPSSSFHFASRFQEKTTLMSIDEGSCPLPKTRGRLILYSTCLPECLPGIGIQKGRLILYSICLPSHILSSKDVFQWVEYKNFVFHLIFCLPKMYSSEWNTKILSSISYFVFQRCLPVHDLNFVFQLVFQLVFHLMILYSITYLNIEDVFQITCSSCFVFRDGRHLDLENFKDTMSIRLNGRHLDLEFFALSIRNTFGLRMFQAHHVHTFDWKTSRLRIFLCCTYGIYLDLENFKHTMSIRLTARHLDLELFALYTYGIHLDLENFKDTMSIRLNAWNTSRLSFFFLAFELYVWNTFGFRIHLHLQFI